MNRTTSVSTFDDSRILSTSFQFEPKTTLDNVSFNFANRSSLSIKPDTNTLPKLFSTTRVATKMRSSTTTTSLLSIRPKVNLYSTTVLSSKRKFDESEHEESFVSNEKLSKLNFKRPRMLDMNKIRSIVLGNQSKTIRMYDESNKTSRAFVLPKLTHQDYYTQPKIDELRELFNDQGQCLLKEFTIGRKHYGSIQFQGSSMNLAGLNLDRIVDIDRRQVTVYPNENDRPNEGDELNCQAIISLIGVYPIDRSKTHHEQEITDPQRLIEINYGDYLKKMTDKFQGSFIAYDVHTGTWKFRVEHF